MGEENRDAENVASPKARRLLPETKQPFGPELADPVGRTGDTSRDEVEQCANADYDPSMIAGQMPVDPFLLQRGAHGDEQQIDAGLLNPLEDECRICPVEVAIRDFDELDRKSTR